MDSDENAIDGIEWLSRMYGHTPRSGKPGAYTNGNRSLRTPRDLVLCFKRYDKRRVLNASTGRVRGSEVIEQSEVELVEVPKGTEVVLYCDVKKAPKGQSVATLFLEEEHVTVFFGQNLVHRRHQRRR